MGGWTHDMLAETQRRLDITWKQYLAGGWDYDGWHRLVRLEAYLLGRTYR